jgi:hypothetical protein
MIVGGKLSQIHCCYQLILPVLLTMRIYALYDRRKWVVWLSVSIGVAETAAACVSAIHSFKSAQ